MDASSQNEHCATEPDAHLMRSGRDGMVLGYNVQTAVEAGSGLIAHHDVTQEPGDTRLLQPVAEGAKQALHADRIEVIADAGYSNGEHLARCEEQGITATVPRRLIPGSKKGLFQKSDFAYDSQHDRYRCPAGKLLERKGEDLSRKLNIYRRSGCGHCPLQPQCTPNVSRMVTRHFHEAAYDRSDARLKADPRLMRRRMTIVERPFAMIKQTMAFRRFSCRGLDGAKAEMAIAVLGYNLKQMIDRLGVPRMLALLA